MIGAIPCPAPITIMSDNAIARKTKKLRVFIIFAQRQSLAKCRYSVLLLPGLLLGKDISLNLYSKAQLYSSSLD